MTKKNVYKKKVSSFLTLFLAVDKVKVLSAVDVYRILANIDEWMIFQENGVKNRSLKLLKEKGAGGCPQEKKLFKKCKVDKKNKKKGNRFGC